MNAVWETWGMIGRHRIYAARPADRDCPRDTRKYRCYVAAKPDGHVLGWAPDPVRLIVLVGAGMVNDPEVNGGVSAPPDAAANVEFFDVGPHGGPLRVPVAIAREIREALG